MKRKKFLIAIFILTLAVIWGHSMMPGDVSSQESLAITRLIKPLLGFYKGSEEFLDLIIRKLAHFTEYAILGAELNVLLRERAYRYPKAIAVAALTAFLDETIQIFSNRGPAIADVWIDTAGAAFATLIVFIYRMRRRCG